MRANIQISVAHGKTTLYYQGCMEDGFIVNIIEKSNAEMVEEGRWKTRQLAYNGKLSFRMGWISIEKEWIDSQNNPLELRLANIIAYFEFIGELHKQNRLNRETERKIREANAEKQKRLVELKENELRKFKELFSLADRFNKTKILRNYVESYRNSCLKRGLITGETASWIRWASEKINWYDPFIENKDELLDGFDRNTIFFNYSKQTDNK